ncbi:unnamed protein product [Colias eurytheme]|nr:unnamed protein product [Colias eurytheme]
MASVTDNIAGVGSEIFNPLPPVLCNNPRLKVEPEKVSLRNVFAEKLPHQHKSKTVIKEETKKDPVPKFPLHISWSPSHFCFDLNGEVMICKLRIWNPGNRTIYTRCCGLWDDSARLGASWKTYPRTRFRLVPGQEGILYIKATPRDHSPIPLAHIGLQIASAHLRDNVVGYFLVPILVKFMTYVPPCLMAEE